MAADREALARAIREARENHGISQEAAAKRLGLSRTVLAQMELGNRTISSDELSKLASLYRKTIEDFLPRAKEDYDALGMLATDPRIPDRLKPAIENVVSLCKEAVALEELLGRRRRAGPPHYDVAPLRNTADAILHGEQVAGQ